MFVFYDEYFTCVYSATQIFYFNYRLILSDGVVIFEYNFNLRCDSDGLSKN